MKRFFGLLFVLVLFGSNYSGLYAQNYVIKERNIYFQQDELFNVLGNKFNDDLDGAAAARLLINMPVSDMLSILEKNSQFPEMGETTIYIAGKNLRVDQMEDEGKTSQFILGDKEAVYHVMWDKKQYIEMTFAEMQQMQKQASAMAEGMMKNMPPEIQAQIEAQMGKAKKEKKESQITKTGKKQTINAFPCEEYLVEGESELRSIWVTAKFPDIRKSMENMYTMLSSFGPPEAGDDDKEIWEKIPGSWPVLMKDVNFNNMYMSLSMDVDETISVEQKNIPADMFKIPADFKKVSMMDMMHGDMDY
ncbi:MAG: DUF4412 domain-containing protein [Calditrichaceae bacterium]